MIRRIFFTLLIFIFTTGFFKSKLEKCADKKVRIDDIIYPFTTVQVPKTKDEIRKDSLKLKKVKEKYKEDKAKGLNPIKFLYDMEVWNLESKYNSVIKRDMDQKIQGRKFKSFLNKNKKIKLENSEYEKVFKRCIKEKERNPELFKAKY